MEYVQMTLDDWLGIKSKIQAELMGLKRSFVRIGYLLRKVEESKGYENDGYKSLSEWAKGEYGLEGSTVSRFMSINREYSIGGFSEDLLPEYEDFKRSQLEEMLKLPAADRAMVRPETQRQDIRDLKAFNKAEPEQGVADTFAQLVGQFFYNNQELLKEVYKDSAFSERNIDRLKDIVNPSGSRSFKKGLYFLMMYESELKVKKFGGQPESYTWQQFFDAMIEVYGEELEEDAGSGDADENEGRDEQGASTSSSRRGEEDRRTGGGIEESDGASSSAGGSEKLEREVHQSPGAEEKKEPNREDGTNEIQPPAEERVESHEENEETEEIAPAQKAEKTAETLEAEVVLEDENVMKVEVVQGVEATIEDPEKAMAAAREDALKAELEAQEEVRKGPREKLGKTGYIERANESLKSLNLAMEKGWYDVARISARLVLEALIAMKGE